MLMAVLVADDGQDKELHRTLRYCTVIKLRPGTQQRTRRNNNKNVRIF